MIKLEIASSQNVRRRVYVFPVLLRQLQITEKIPSILTLLINYNLICYILICGR